MMTSRRTFATLLVALLAGPLLAFPGNAKTFSQYQAASFLKLLGSGEPVIVHVHADWCSVCRAQIGVMDKVLSAAAYRAVHTVRVNFDKEKQFLTDHKVVRQSTILVFKGGKEIARLSYDADPQRIEQTLQKSIS